MSGTSSSSFGESEQCCDGSFAYVFQGPAKGFVPILLTIFSCAPVIILMMKIYNGTQRFDIIFEDKDVPANDGMGGDIELQEQADAVPVVSPNTGSDESTIDATRDDTGDIIFEEQKQEEEEEVLDSSSDRHNHKVVGGTNGSDNKTTKPQLPTKLRNQLLISGMAKLATRIYACLYASAAAGSAHACNPNASSVVNVCLNAGFGYEAFVLGYSGIAAGILDWMTLVGRPVLPLGSSLSSIRWQVINDRRCVCLESVVLGILLVLLAIVGAGGHIWSAADTAGTIVAVLVGIVVVIGALVIICGLTPFVVCAVGVCGTCRDDGDEGDVMARSWEAVRVIFLEMPGIFISFFGNPAALIGWIIDIMDSGTDFFLDHCLSGGVGGE